MNRTAGFLILALALFGEGAGLQAAEPIRAEIARAQATPYRVGDRDMAGFQLKFDLRLVNSSGKPLEIPKVSKGRGVSSRVVVLNVQTKKDDGRWAFVVQSSWYDTGSTKYEPCTLLPPGGAAEFANVPGGLVVLKSQLAGLGNQPSVRFGLVFMCRQPDGDVITQATITEAFELRLPAPR